MMASKPMRTLLGIIFLDQTYITITFPLVTLIFFDSQSRLFSDHTPDATRSLWYGACVALPNMINLFFAPLLSALSDEWGRRRVLLIEIFSAFLFTASVGLGIYLGELSLIFLGFIIRGAFSRTNPTALSMMGDMAPAEKKILYMGYLQFAISIGASLGPILGGFFAIRYYFDQLNFALPFFIGAGLALINTVLSYYFMPETLLNPHKKQGLGTSLSAMKQTLLQPRIVSISFALLLLQLSWSMYYQFIPPLLKTYYHFNANGLGWFIGMIAIWLALATSIGIKLLQRFFTVRKLLLLSFYLVLMGLMITLIATLTNPSEHEALIWLGAMPVAMGDVVAYSCLTALYSNAVPSYQQGKVMGISFIIVSSAWAFTAFLGGFLLSISPLLPLLIAPISIVSLLFFMQVKTGKQLTLNFTLG